MASKINYDSSDVINGLNDIGAVPETDGYDITVYNGEIQKIISTFGKVNSAVASLVTNTNELIYGSGEIAAPIPSLSTLETYLFNGSTSYDAWKSGMSEERTDFLAKLYNEINTALNDRMLLLENSGGADRIVLTTGASDIVKDSGISINSSGTLESSTTTIPTENTVKTYADLKMNKLSSASNNKILLGGSNATSLKSSGKEIGGSSLASTPTANTVATELGVKTYADTKMSALNAAAPDKLLVGGSTATNIKSSGMSVKSSGEMGRNQNVIPTENLIADYVDSHSGSDDDSNALRDVVTLNITISKTGKRVIISNATVISKYRSASYYTVRAMSSDWKLAEYDVPIGDEISALNLDDSTDPFKVVAITDNRNTIYLLLIDTVADDVADVEARYGNCTSSTEITSGGEYGEFIEIKMLDNCASSYNTRLTGTTKAYDIESSGMLTATDITGLVNITFKYEGQQYDLNISALEDFASKRSDNAFTGINEFTNTATFTNKINMYSGWCNTTTSNRIKEVGGLNTDSLAENDIIAIKFTNDIAILGEQELLLKIGNNNYNLTTNGIDALTTHNYTLGSYVIARQHTAFIQCIYPASSSMNGTVRILNPNVLIDSESTSGDVTASGNNTFTGENTFTKAIKFMSGSQSRTFGYSNIGDLDSLKSYIDTGIRPILGQGELETGSVAISSNNATIGTEATYCSIISSYNSSIGDSSVDDPYDYNSIIGGRNNAIYGYSSAIIGGWDNTNNGNCCVIIGGSANITGSGTSNDQVILGGKYNNPGATDKVIVGGGTDDSHRANLFRVDSTGKTYGNGSWNSSGADYAEYFEWLDSNPNSDDRVGLFVTLDGENIRFATSSDDYVLGVVSGSPTVVGDAPEDVWHSIWLRDMYGRIQYHTVHYEAEYREVEETDPETGETTKKNVLVREAHDEVEPIVNPDYDPSKEYVPRSKRPEWATVGMMGKLVVIDDGTCKVNGYATVSDKGDGTATAATSDSLVKYRVLARLDETHVKVLFR